MYTDILVYIVPTDITTWEWLFEPTKYSPLYKTPQQPLAGYVNAITKERLDWAEVKAKATQLSTALIRGYGLQAGDTVSLFSTNTIWYPVAMWAVIRAGMFAQHDLSKRLDPTDEQTIQEVESTERRRPTMQKR